MKKLGKPLVLLTLVCAISILPAKEDRIPKVINGIDILREQDFRPLAGKRVGLITNQTGLSEDGTSTIELLLNSKTCKLVALFSPEHGIRGNLDEEISSFVDETTGLPVYSLYGNTRRPTPEMLAGIDALVFDIQDIGARFYTYITTMAYCMEEAAKAGISFLVLDRPNPIGGNRIEGPMLDEDKTSFVGYMPLPIRHGMTIGELARYFNTENGINAHLQVIPMRGWRRNYFFWDTGQLWVNPSPNMRNIFAAILYPGICLLEGTNISVGRGTDRPFEIVGAPWIEPVEFAFALQAEQVAGIRSVPITFTPSADKYRGVKCGGINLLVTDPERLSSVLLGLTIISVLHRLYPEKFEMNGLMRLLGNKEAFNGLKAGEKPVDILRHGHADVRKFLAKRKKALIYD